jgi:MHS family proline/betaine transporter-like MFS transporter
MSQNIESSMVYHNKDKTFINPNKTSQNTLLMATLIGIVLEWYSYSLYGFFAPILAHIYFPNKDILFSLMLVFASYAAGFVAGPLGAIFFGHIGDRYGRKFVLTRAITLMAIATGLIAVLPGFHAIGYLAPLILTLLLMMQGFAVSGEDNASTITLIETFPAHYRALLGSAVGTASAIGILFSCMIGILVTNLHLPDWTWRLAFALGLLLGLIGLLLRMKCFESPIFNQIKSQHQIEKIPLLVLIRRTKSTFFHAIGVSWLQATSVTLNTAFMSTYLISTQKWSMHNAMSLSGISLIIAIILTPIIGWLAMQKGIRKTMLYSSGVYLISAYPLYYLLQLHNNSLTILSVLLLNILAVCYVAPTPAYVCNLFPANIRFSGVAIANNIAWVIFGGFIPFIATYLIHITHNAISPCILLIAAALCSFITLLSASNQQKYELH